MLQNCGAFSCSLLFVIKIVILEYNKNNSKQIQKKKSFLEYLFKLFIKSLHNISVFLVIRKENIFVQYPA